MDQSFLDYMIPLVIFGWPLYIISILTAVVGVTNNQYGFVLLSALLILPFTYYLNGLPYFAGFALLLPLLHIASAAAVKEDKETWAWVLLSPTLIVRIWLLLVAWVSRYVGPS